MENRKNWTNKELLKNMSVWKGANVRTRHNWSTTCKKRMEEMMFEAVDRGLWK